MSRTDIVSYIPAIHQGYVDFIERNPGRVHLLGQDFVAEQPRLERDIRALRVEHVKLALGSLGVADSVEVLTKQNLPDLVAQAGDILMPDEDANRRFAEVHLSASSVRYESAFLRWDWQASTKKEMVVPDVVISQNELDQQLMQLASQQTEKSPDWWRQVGGIMVMDGLVVARAHNEQYPPSDYNLNTFGDPRSNFDAGEKIELSKVLHTEAKMIADAANQGHSTKDAELYVTTFPCPNCARLIAASGMSKVYFSEGYSLLDAQDVLNSAGVQIVQVVVGNPD